MALGSLTSNCPTLPTFTVLSKERVLLAQNFDSAIITKPSFKVFEQFLHNSKKRVEDKLAAKITPIFPNCSNITININNNNNIFNDSNLFTLHTLGCGLVGLLQIY